MSGGTTEILKCIERPYGYETSIIGGTKDISIGMLLDRIGVAMGKEFPAGKYMDEMAILQKNSLTTSMRTQYMNRLKKIKIRDGKFNLSGIESQAMKLLDEGYEDFIGVLFYRISVLLAEAVNFAIKTSNLNTVFMAGGVASSSYIRNALNDISCSFVSPELSGDNAIGISMLGRRAYYETGNGNAAK